MKNTSASNRAILDVLEPRVLLSGPPTKFVMPIGGVPQIDWAIMAYTDQNPAPGVASDYRGRGYTFDGANSVHFGLADLATMDRGIEVYAAAPGTVVEAHDGEFDRNMVFLEVPPQDNYVLVDHGDGWMTRYGRMRNGSVIVSPGQVVTAGQQLGLVGGSGNLAPDYFESAAILDFAVTHNGEHIETFLDPQAYWQSPPPFTGDVPAAFSMDTTDKLPTNNAADGFAVDEHLSLRSVFHPGEQVVSVVKWHGLNGGPSRQYRYFRPDGSSFTDAANFVDVDRAVTTRPRAITLTGSNAQLGTWQVAAEFGGVELGRTSFHVADASQGLPEIKVFQNATYVIDGRTTPLDFGRITTNDGDERRAFTISNYGTKPLNINSITLPTGFSIVGSAPTTIAAATSATLTIQLDDDLSGSKGGQVVISGNDADNANFTFNIKGIVEGSIGAPPEQFVLPVGGVPQVDWAIGSYTDRDPSPGASLDYRGRQYAFDGSHSVTFALPDFAAMDKGVDVLAAASGTIVEVHDGEFDRHNPFVNRPPANTPDNYVLIDHGNGWMSRYGRLRNGSINVTTGQGVAAGQKIGQVGGSGTPAPAIYSQGGAYLTFDVTHDGEYVETFRNSSAFWQNPLPFAGDVPRLDYMVTAAVSPPANETWESTAAKHVFHVNEQVWVLTKWHGLNREAPRQYRYIRPDETQVMDAANTTAEDRPQVNRLGSITLTGANAQLGTWQVAAILNGVELGRTSFLVADPSQGLPEIKVYDNTNYVVDGRTTPIDFGTILQSSGGSIRSFTVSNYGTNPLTPGEVTVPPGFSIRRPLPGLIPAGGFATLVIQLDDALAGSRSGQIIIHSDDADNAEFNFVVKGTVAPVAPIVNADNFLFQRAPQRLSFTLSHNVSASLSAADLKVENQSTGGTLVVVGEPNYDLASNIATFAFAGNLPDGNYRATLSAAGVLNGNTPMAADHVMNFFVLTGDLNHDRTVSIADFITLASHFSKSDATYSDGDMNYDGIVSIADFIDLASKFGTTLVNPAAPAPQSPASFTLVASDDPTADAVGHDVLGCERQSARTRHRRQSHHRRQRISAPAPRQIFASRR
jgi:murein DD-endopeptidase MepM/ murein hydrolase activator NlpD